MFYTSGDGTKVPMFLVGRKGRSTGGGDACTLLYGYGGFSIRRSSSPSRFLFTLSSLPPPLLDSGFLRFYGGLSPTRGSACRTGGQRGDATVVVVERAAAAGGGGGWGGVRTHMLRQPP